MDKPAPTFTKPIVTFPCGFCECAHQELRNYGVIKGLDIYCRLVKTWTSNLKKCPVEDKAREIKEK